MSRRYQTRAARAQSAITAPTMTLYVLKCSDSCWYVGITGDMSRRWNQHSTGRGAEWTKVHTPLSIYSERSVPESDAKHEEAVLTSEMMLKYGVNKVRGASLTYARKYDLRESDVRMVAGVIRKALDLNYTEVREQIIEELEAETPRQSAVTKDTFDEVGMLASVLGVFNIGTGTGSTRSSGASGSNAFSRGMTTRSSAASSGGDSCSRCGRNSHRRDDCYATTHLNGRRIWKSGCEKCGRNSHLVGSCYARTDLYGNAI